MRAHEAGALHGNDAAPTWLPYPADVNTLIDGLWSRTTARNAEGAVEVGGVDVRRIAEEVGTPAFVLDEDDFRHRARAFRDAFAEAFRPHRGADVYYAGKAFLCGAVARWVEEDGLGLDVCTGGELAVALRAGFPASRIALHGNNKSASEIRRALEAGVGRIVIDSLDEIDQVDEIAARLGLRAGVMLRVTTGVEAHTHEFIATAHEDQKFGLSLTGGSAFEAVHRVLDAPQLDLLGLHSHIGSQIFDTGGFEVAARRVLQLVARVRDELGHTIDQLDLGGGFGVMYNTQHTPSTPEALAAGIAGIVEKQCHELELDVPHLAFEPGRAIAGPSTQTLYSVGTVKDVRLGGPHHRVYVSVDGGMSDNVRTALYDADYSCLLTGRVSEAAPEVVRVVGKHCESGDIVVKDEYLPADVRRGDLISVPVTGAYCYSLASNYNHVPRPPVIAVRDGEIRTLIRRETEEDLLGLDVG
ncbi:diaminopimelate decarboxylase [Brachybacterium faecium DSM 4810]|uniref:Diaminopimelate decarboxylase n=1 Tax=Brachybacterium faecium (strain ATCC 43885 / DSM 4810 / JCM 11609 / LMG 19847 / NBRC 14762 / NCIMB 9860 / 6-10) TaxID=446465 RepID=C7MDU4_BRAFD|nr:diaminopimelate decarboxylase [Brachybacterium faecium]ACU85751.1 diaminopimelate decarboxylase [Brachybacterium faecium DSM 4810]